VFLFGSINHSIRHSSLVNSNGAIIGAVVKATAKMSDLADKMLDDFTYLIYLLPFFSLNVSKVVS